MGNQAPLPREHLPPPGVGRLAANALAEIIEADDPDEFGTRATPTYGSRLVLRGKGGFTAQRMQLLLDGVVVNRGLTNQPTTFHVETGQRVIFSFAAAPGGGERAIQGKPFLANAVAWWRTDAEIHTQWPANFPWWNLVFPLATIEQAIQSIWEGRLLMPRDSVRLVPLTHHRWEEITSALEGALAAPSTVHKGRLADGLLTLVLSSVAPAGDTREGSRASMSQARRLRIADGLVALGDRVSDPVSLLSVCRQLDVSLRTLNACSSAVLGLGAANYLRQRRLNRVYHELRHGMAASVTEAAVRHGFWELGRFAGSFRAAFGESPSRTLRRGRTRPAGTGAAWSCA